MKDRRLNRPQTEFVLELLYDLKTHWRARHGGMDALYSMDWLEEAIEELFLEFPRVIYLRIFVKEAEKCAPISREIRDRVDMILSLLAD